MAETPGNPFREGAEQSVDAQKIALTKMLAEQGSVGAQIRGNRAEDAVGINAVAQREYGTDAKNPLYATFERDAAQAAQFQQGESARIQAANQAYLDQVKAALPIHQRDTDAYYEALRKEYEDRKAEREQQMALARMAAARSGGGGGTSATTKAQQAMAVTNPLQRTPSLAAAAGAAAGQRSIVDAAKALGFDPKAAEKRWVKGDPKSQFYQQDQALRRAIEQGINTALAEDATWAAVVAEGRALAEQLGLSYEANVQPWLAVYSPLWGVQDSEWAVPIPKGRTR